MLEPAGRNTAPAVALAALQVARSHGRDALLLVLPADHLIRDQAPSRAAVARRLQLARDGLPGHLRHPPDASRNRLRLHRSAASRLARHRAGCKVVALRREADARRAAGLPAQPATSSGTPACSASAPARCSTSCALHAPEVLQGAPGVLGGMASSTGRRHAGDSGRAVRRGAPSISIDYALMEQLRPRRRRARHASAGTTSAPGRRSASWSRPTRDSNRAHRRRHLRRQPQQLHPERGPPGRRARRRRPDHRRHAGRAAGGADQTTRRTCKQGRRSELKSRGHEAFKLHRTVRGPGAPTPCSRTATGFKIKRIVVKPGASLSLQMHHHRSEHWIVVHGMARVVNGEQELLPAHQRVHLHPGRASPPAGEPGPARPGDDRGAERGLPGRGRHRAVRGYLRARVTLPLTN